MPHLSSITYNASNEMATANLGGGGMLYNQYSGGQRGRKTKVNGTTTEVRMYFGNYEIYRKFVSGSLTLERTTVHINDDAGRVAMYDKRTGGTDSYASSTVRYQYSNHLSTASLELDGSAAIISYEEYHPYGTSSYKAMNASVNAVAKRYKYTGKERDEETGLYYIGARYYCPWLARWCADDPINSEWYNLVKGVPQRNGERDVSEIMASGYEYCYDNPVQFTDPTGEQAPRRPLSGTKTVTSREGKASQFIVTQDMLIDTPKIKPIYIDSGIQPERGNPAQTLLANTITEVKSKINELNTAGTNLKGALDVIITNYKLDKIAPNFVIKFQDNEWEHRGALETKGKIGEQQTLELSRGDLYYALDKMGFANFVIGLAHEFIHANQKGIAHSPVAKSEREFLANQFSVFPNKSIVAREGMIDFHGVTFPNPSIGFSILWSADALRHYANNNPADTDATSDGFREQYRQDAINLGNNFMSLYNSLPQATQELPRMKELYTQTNAIINQYNLH